MIARPRPVALEATNRTPPPALTASATALRQRRFGAQIVWHRVLLLAATGCLISGATRHRSTDRPGRAYLPDPSERGAIRGRATARPDDILKRMKLVTIEEAWPSSGVRGSTSMRASG
jgi:hypothetical protein